MTYLHLLLGDVTLWLEPCVVNKLHLSNIRSVCHLAYATNIMNSMFSFTYCFPYMAHQKLVCI